METRTRTSWPSISLVFSLVTSLVFVRLSEAAAAESLEPDVPETVCDTIKKLKLDCKDIPKLSVAARTSLFSECLLQDVIS